MTNDEIAGLMKNDPAAYWQTAGPMKQAAVTIEFDKPCLIDSFELGARAHASAPAAHRGPVNAGSAFLEVRLTDEKGNEDLLLVRPSPNGPISSPYSQSPATLAASLAGSTLSRIAVA